MIFNFTCLKKQSVDINFAYLVWTHMFNQNVKKKLLAQLVGEILNGAMGVTTLNFNVIVAMMNKIRISTKYSDLKNKNEIF